MVSQLGERLALDSGTQTPLFKRLEPRVPVAVALAAGSELSENYRSTPPKRLGGAGGAGTNPGQLFAAGYSACFIGATAHQVCPYSNATRGNIDMTPSVA